MAGEMTPNGLDRQGRRGPGGWLSSCRPWPTKARWTYVASSTRSIGKVDPGSDHGRGHGRDLVLDTEHRPSVRAEVLIVIQARPSSIIWVDEAVQDISTDMAKSTRSPSWHPGLSRQSDPRTRAHKDPGSAPAAWGGVDQASGDPAEVGRGRGFSGRDVSPGRDVRHHGGGRGSSVPSHQRMGRLRHRRRTERGCDGIGGAAGRRPAGHGGRAGSRRAPQSLLSRLSVEPEGPVAPDPRWVHVDQPGQGGPDRQQGRRRVHQEPAGDQKRRRAACQRNGSNCAWPNWATPCACWNRTSSGSGRTAAATSKTSCRNVWGSSTYSWRMPRPSRSRRARVTSRCARYWRAEATSTAPRDHRVREHPGVRAKRAELIGTLVGATHDLRPQASPDHCHSGRDQRGRRRVNREINNTLAGLRNEMESAQIHEARSQRPEA